MKKIIFLSLILCLILLGYSDNVSEQTNLRNFLYEKPHFTIPESEALAADNGNGNSNGYYHYGVFQVRNYYFVKNWKVYTNIRPSE